MNIDDDFDADEANKKGEKKDETNSNDNDIKPNRKVK